VGVKVKHSFKTEREAGEYLEQRGWVQTGYNVYGELIDRRADKTWRDDAPNTRRRIEQPVPGYFKIVTL